MEVDRNTCTGLPEHEASVPQLYSQTLFALRTLNSDTKEELAHLFLKTIKVYCMTQLCFHFISARYIAYAVMAQYVMLSRLKRCNSYFSVQKKREEIINSNVIQDLES